MNMAVDMTLLGNMAWLVIHAFVVLIWNMLWPLTAGFMISALVRAWTPAGVITRHLGRNGPLAALGALSFGCISSVCNYAVVGMGKTLYDKGATWPNILVYMLASTNLGITMLLSVYGFMGVNALLLLVFTTLVCLLVVWMLGLCCLPSDLRSAQPEEEQNGQSPWLRTAVHFYDDIAMTRKDILVGIFIASMAAGLIPEHWWDALFLQEVGPSFLVWLWNATLGLMLASLSFGCSIGNVALAAVLWWNGASPGGVMAFMLGSLLTAPMLHIFVRNYGPRMAWNVAWVQIVGILGASLLADALLWLHPISMMVEHSPTEADHAAFMLLIGNILWGAVGIAFYLKGKKHSDMGNMQGHDMDHSHMDHNHMDHEHMDHSHMGHAPMDHSAMGGHMSHDGMKNMPPDK